MVGKLLVVGSTGQLARALKGLRPDAVFLGRDVLDLAYPERIQAVLEKYTPSAIIDAAAYTAVDKAETEEKLSTAVNAESPAVIASYCAVREIPFVYFSSDYVFDGSGDAPWKEGDMPAPLNAYGRSKLAGEKAVASTGAQYLLFRTSWVYDAEGKNFVNTILKLAAERDELRVIDDQYGAPTYAPDLAAGVLKALDRKAFPPGIYHLCNSGVTTWFGFASAIIEHARQIGLPVKVKKILPIPATEYKLPAPRPYNSRLDCARALSMVGVALPSWQEGLKRCMELKK